MENEEEVTEEVVSLFDESGNPLPQEPAAGKQEPNQEVAPAEDENTFVVPDKFKDKSLEEVVQSYMELEKLNGNMGNEMGQLRKLTDQILLNQQTPQPAAQPAVEETNDVGFDDFIDDPQAAVNAALANNPTIKALEAQIVEGQVDKARERMLAAHPDADQLISDPQFLTWLNENPSRRRRLEEAHVKGDADTANDMLSLYKQTRQITNEEATTERDAKAAADLKNAVTETGKAPASTKKIYRRSELIDLKIRAPQQYEAMSEEIHAAYAEGRVK